MQDTAALRSQLAIAARPRQTDPTDPDVIASAPRPTVADQPAIDTLATADPVAIFIDGHAKRLAGPEWDDLDCTEQDWWASQVHDVLNNLRAVDADGGEPGVADGRKAAASPDCTACGGDGEASHGSCGVPDCEHVTSCSTCGGIGRRPTDAEVAALRDEHDRRGADLQVAELELAAYRARQAGSHPWDPPTLPADLRGLLDALVAAKDAIDAGDLHDLGHILRLDAYEEAVGAVAEWHRGAGDVDAEPATGPLSDGELISLWGQYVGSPPSPNGMTLMRAIRDHAGGGR